VKARRSAKKNEHEARKPGEKQLKTSKARRSAKKIEQEARKPGENQKLKTNSKSQTSRYPGREGIR
jgi:hypothetical protein